MIFKRISCGWISAFFLSVTLPITASTLFYGSLSVSGGNSLTAESSPIISLSGGTFTGFDGDSVNDVLYLQNNPDAAFHQILSNGGSGVYLSGVSLLTINPTNAASFTGGNGGTVTGTSSASDVYANGGSGLSVSSGGNIFGNPQRNQESTFSTIDSGLLTVAGAGIVLTYNSQVGNGTYYGGSAGNATFSAGSVMVTGGSGLTIESISNNRISVVSGGPVTAGSFSNSVFAGGTDSVLILNTNLLIQGGTFTGGYGGSVASLTATSSDVEILGGSFLGGNGGIATGTQSVLAQGGKGFLLSSCTNLNISGAQFKGGNGGSAIQSNTDDRSYVVDASGGAGLRGSSIHQTTFSNIVATGGNGGKATGSYPLPAAPEAIMNSSGSIYYYPYPPSQPLHANGGAGAFINESYDSRTSDFAIEDSTFKGGQGGTITGDLGPDSYYFFSSASAVGGNGLEINAYNSSSNTNRMTLKNIAAYGGKGGQALDAGGETSDHSIHANVAGGNGAEIWGFNDVLIDGGHFVGGDGGMLGNEDPRRPSGSSARIMTGSIAGNRGGEGMYLSSRHASIFDGTFIGGTSSKQSGSGLRFYGDSLEIFDGEFISPRNNPYSISWGLDARVSDSLTIHNGHFSSISAQSSWAGEYTDVYIGSAVENDGYLSLLGNFRFETIEPGTLQRLSFSGNHLILEDDWELRDGGRAGIYGNLTATDIKLRNGSALALIQKSEMDSLKVDAGATLLLRESYTEQRDPPTELFIGAARFEQGSTLQAQYRNWLLAPGAGWDIADLYATDLSFVSGTNNRTMTQDDLTSISSGIYNYLTDYTFNLSTSSTGQHIRVSVTGIALTNKKDNPLPSDLTAFIDNYRSLNLSSENFEIEQILYYLTYDPIRTQARRELKQYFNTQASPMALRSIQAGQQAQLNQVLKHAQAVRSAPSGAAGPTEKPKDWAGWIKGYGTDSTKDSDANYPGYDANIAGMVIGIEKAGENTLIGVAGGSSRTDVNTDEPGSSDVETYFGSIYASFGGKSTFIDTSLSYGHNQVDGTRGSITPSTAQYNVHNFMGYIGGGRQYQINDKLSFTPELGGQLCYYFQEGFTETGILNNTYEDYDYWYVQSILGAQIDLKLPAGDALVFIPELRLHWNHNFNPDPDRISYTTGGTGTGATASIQSPEEDTLIIGAGLVTKVTNRVNIDLRIDQQLSKGWKSTTVGGSLKVNF